MSKRNGRPNLIPDQETVRYTIRFPSVLDFKANIIMTESCVNNFSDFVRYAVAYAVTHSDPEEVIERGKHAFKEGRF